MICLPLLSILSSVFKYLSTYTPSIHISLNKLCSLPTGNHYHPQFQHHHQQSRQGRSWASPSPRPPRTSCPARWLQRTASLPGKYCTLNGPQFLNILYKAPTKPKLVYFFLLFAHLYFLRNRWVNFFI